MISFTFSSEDDVYLTEKPLDEGAPAFLADDGTQIAIDNHIGRRIVFMLQLALQDGHMSMILTVDSVLRFEVDGSDHHPDLSHNVFCSQLKLLVFVSLIYIIPNPFSPF